MSAPKKKAGWGAGEAALLAAIDRGEVSAAYMAVAQPLSGLDNTKPLAKLDKACRQAERFLDVAMTRAGAAPCSAAQRKAAEHAATTALDKLFQTRWKDAPADVAAVDAAIGARLREAATSWAPAAFESFARALGRCSPHLTSVERAAPTLARLLEVAPKAAQKKLLPLLDRARPYVLRLPASLDEAFASLAALKLAPSALRVGPPATAAAITASAKRLGVAFPPEARALYARANGIGAIAALADLPALRERFDRLRAAHAADADDEAEGDRTLPSLGDPASLLPLGADLNGDLLLLQAGANAATTVWRFVHDEALVVRPEAASLAELVGMLALLVAAERDGDARVAAAIADHRRALSP